MKKNLLIVILLLLVIDCFAQGFGFDSELSTDKKYLIVSDVRIGGPAFVAGLKPGDRILKIDNKDIGEVPDPGYYINTTGGKWLNLLVNRYEKPEIFEINIPRISVNFPTNVTSSDNYITELEIVTACNFNITNSIVPYNGPSDFINELSVYFPTSKDLYLYKTYDFKSTAIGEDSINEQIIFNEIEKMLDIKGMTHSTTNPDILILFRNNSWSKETYIPQKQVITTNTNTTIKRTYNWYWGWIPVAQTQTQVNSTTTGGYTKKESGINSTIQFLDAKEIPNSKSAPVIWSASIDDYRGGACPINLFPYSIPHPQIKSLSCIIYKYDFHYAYTGIIYDKNNFPKIADVIPDSPADKAGIKKGDYILNINGFELIKTLNKYKFYRTNNEEIMFAGYSFNGEDSKSGFRYLWIYAKSKEPIYANNSKTLAFSIKRGNKELQISFIPEDKVVDFYEPNPFEY